MRTADEILKYAKQLPADERRRIADKLLESAEEEEISESEVDERRLDAMKEFLELAGTGHSDFADVSREKYKHLAEIYADKK